MGLIVDESLRGLRCEGREGEHAVVQDETLVRCRDFGYLVVSNARWQDAEEVLLEESA